MHTLYISIFTKHMRIHTGEKHQKCGHFGIIFVLNHCSNCEKSSLKKICTTTKLKIHTEEKLYLSNTYNINIKNHKI